jgi:hypothetical protein
MTRKHLISVCAVALMAGCFSPAYAADNGPAGIDVDGLLAFDGGGGVSISTGLNNGAPPPADGAGGSGAGISTAGVPGPSNGFDGGGGSGSGISTGGVAGPSPAGGTAGADGGGGVGISTAGVPGPGPAGGTTTYDGGGGSGGSI